MAKHHKKPKPKPKPKKKKSTGGGTTTPATTTAATTAPQTGLDVSGSSGGLLPDDGTGTDGAAGNPAASGDLTGTTQLVDAVFGSGAGFAPQLAPVSYTLQPAPQEAQAQNITAASTAAGAGATS